MGGHVEKGPVSLKQAWEHGFSWMTLDDDSLDAVVVAVAMVITAAEGDGDRATEFAAHVLTTLMLAFAYALDTPPRSMADDMFMGLVDGEGWPKVQARISERLRQMASGNL